MVTLFDQGERQYAARLAGMKAPVSLRTPPVEDALVYPSRVKAYVQQQMNRLPFAIPAAQAMKLLLDREAIFTDTGHATRSCVR